MPSRSRPPSPGRKPSSSAPTRPAAEATLTIAQAGPEDLRGYAAWWVKHRATNDWRTFGVGQYLAGGDLEDAELVFDSGLRRDRLHARELGPLPRGS